MDAGLSRPLAAYRVVELPGAVPMQFGKTFADLGAEAIKVEPPDGDPARRLPPFAESGPHAGQSLYWLAYAQGKQSVTADLSSDAGRSLLRRLAATADVIVEAYPPGWLADAGLGYERLRVINPRLVMTSISPFGQTGPYAQRLSSDLINLAMSGYLNMTGPPDGAPLKPSAPYQTFFHSSMQAVAATLLALRQRRRTGLGTHVDQAMRDTGMWMLTHTYQFWDLLQVNLKRQGAARDMGGVLRLPSVWRASDGYIVWLFQTGHVGGARLRMLVDWMEADGMAPEWIRSIAWEEFDLLAAGPDVSRRLSETFAAFFSTKPKTALFDWALPRGVMLAPVQTLADVSADVQLASRASWRTVEAAGTDHCDDELRVPGPPVRLTAGDWEPRGPAPGLGEHNDAVYTGLLDEG
ncbi:MAG: CaiB/BaiF CoA transferase family protein [Dehalococcoidia bacterium]